MNNNLRISFAPMKVRRNTTMKTNKVPVATPLAPSTRRASIQKVNVKENIFPGNVYGASINKQNKYQGNLSISPVTQQQNITIINKLKLKNMKKGNNSSLYTGVVNLPEAPIRNPYKHIFQKSPGSRNLTNKEKRSLTTSYVNPISGGVSRKVKVRSLPKYRKTYKRITY